MPSTVHRHPFRTPGRVTLRVEHFGDAAAPLVLLAGGKTMLSWPDAPCGTQVCSVCRVEKAITALPTTSRNKDGVLGRGENCPACRDAK